jgi:hypothetical protein
MEYTRVRTVRAATTGQSRKTSRAFRLMAVSNRSPTQVPAKARLTYWGSTSQL